MEEKVELEIRHLKWAIVKLIHEAEDIVREKCAMIAYVEVKSRTLHDKDDATAQVVAQAIREGK